MCARASIQLACFAGACQILVIIKEQIKVTLSQLKLLQGHFTEYKGRLIISYQLSVVRKRRMEQGQFEPSPERG